MRIDTDAQCVTFHQCEEVMTQATQGLCHVAFASSLFSKEVCDVGDFYRGAETGLLFKVVAYEPDKLIGIIFFIYAEVRPVVLSAMHTSFCFRDVSHRPETCKLGSILVGHQIIHS